MHGQLEYTRGRHGDVWVPLLDYFSAYRKNEEYLGLLTHDEVRALTAAYYTYQVQIGFAARLGGWDVKRDDGIGGSLLVPAEQAPWLEGCLKATHNSASIAYEVLGRELTSDAAANKVERISQPLIEKPAGEAS